MVGGLPRTEAHWGRAHVQRVQSVEAEGLAVESRGAVFRAVADRSSRGRVLGTIALALFGGICLASAPVAAGRAAKPTVSSFGAPASVGVDGGRITLSGSVSNASSCAFSSAKAVSEPPVTLPCSTAVSVEVVLPPDPARKAITYTLTLKVMGAGGKVTARTKTVVHAPPKHETCQVGPGAYLVGCDLSYAELEGVNLKGANLQGTNLEEAKLSRVSSGGITGTPSALPTHWMLTAGYLIGPGASLEGASLADANLQGAELYEANLARANLEGADLEGAELDRANLQGARLTGAHLGGAHVDGANLEGADLEGANVADADMSNEDLEGASLEGADLVGARLGGANLERANLTDANLEGVASGLITGTPSAIPAHWTLVEGYLIGAGAQLGGENLEGVNLEGGNLEGAHLERANLKSATLTNARLEGAQMLYTQLEGATLTDANLTGAELTFAHMEGAHGEGAELEGANLNFAHLSGADLESANLNKALTFGATLDGVNWASATCPDDSNSNEDDNTCEGHLG